MTHQPVHEPHPAAADAGQQVAQLRHVLSLVEQIAGRELAPNASDHALDDGARASSAYWDAPSIVQRRFDSLANETTIWVAEAVEALLAVEDEARPPRAAAARLAIELEKTLAEMGRILKL